MVYDVRVEAIGFDKFDKNKRLLECLSATEEMVLKILDSYGNAANCISICEVPEHKEDNG